MEFLCASDFGLLDFQEDLVDPLRCVEGKELRDFTTRLALVPGEPSLPSGFQQNRKSAWPVVGSNAPRSEISVSDTQTESSHLRWWTINTHDH